MMQALENLDEEGQRYNYSHIRLIEEPPAPIEVPYPTLESLADLNISGIDGSNQRVGRSSFYFLLARAAIIEFRYSTINAKPYFYNRIKDSSAVLWVDGNIFREDVQLHTSSIDVTNPEEKNVLRGIGKNNGRPYLFRYDSKNVDKSPANHALGWAVKIQQALELHALRDVPTAIKGVCIKDGPLFPTSLSTIETISGLGVIDSWNEQTLVACSKRVQDSRLLVELLLRSSEVRNYWFANQNLAESTINNISSDSILLPRILKPGYRTPFVEAVPRARSEVVRSRMDMMPIACYYLSRQRPHTYIRLEIPRLQWQRSKDRVNEAVRIVAWQHELGKIAPLIQLVADERCQLAAEKAILENLTAAAVSKHDLDLPEGYEESD
jgi:NurA domain-containing protein